MMTSMFDAVLTISNNVVPTTLFITFVGRGGGGGGMKIFSKTPFDQYKSDTSLQLLTSFVGNLFQETITKVNTKIMNIYNNAFVNITYNIE